MRKLLRSIARASMRRAGIQRMNKRYYFVRNGVVCKTDSYFSQHWRDYA